MARSTVTVIIPAYNAAAFIGEALDSVLAQTMPPEEVVVVNDGSTDNTLAILKSYELRFGGRLRILDQPNAGVAAARNAAFGAAQGDIVAMLDADNAYFPTFIETVHQAFTAMPEIVLFFADTEILEAAGPTGRLNSEGKPVRTMPAQAVGDLFRAEGSLFTRLLGGSFIPVCTTAVRRDVALAAGLFDLGIRTSEDRDFFCRMSLRGPFGFSRQVLAYERIHGTNISMATKATALAGNILAVKRKLRRPEYACLMSDEQRAELEASYNRSLANYAYALSLEGLGSYASGLARLSPRERTQAFSWRGLLRAMAVSLGLHARPK